MTWTAVPILFEGPRQGRPGPATHEGYVKMLMIPIPSGETSGSCRINGETCEFKISGDEFAFRKVGSPEWDRRAIAQRMPSGKLTTYVCGNAGDPLPPTDDNEPTHAQLRSLVEQCEPQLADCWGRRRDDSDVMVLGDIRRPDCRKMAVEQYGREQVEQALVDAGRIGSRPMVPMLQPASFIEILRGTGGFAHREAAKELAAFTRLGPMGIVPLLVIPSGGLWATQWARPDSKTVVVRYQPDTPPEAN